MEKDKGKFKRQENFYFALIKYEIPIRYKTGDISRLFKYIGL